MTHPLPEAVSYFNLHTTGIGYLNRIREVSVRGGNTFMACDVMALHGDANAVEHTRFDCKVVGQEADRLVRLFRTAVTDRQKVLVAFRIGDLWIDPFIYLKGEKTGEPGASLKGRLLFIYWIKVDGVLVHHSAAKSETTTSDPATPQSVEGTTEIAHTG